VRLSALRSSGIRLLRTEPATVGKSGLVGNNLVGCGCPLTDTPHTREEHALACLRRDFPHLYPTPEDDGG
jgi:hypothetical protein